MNKQNQLIDSLMKPNEGTIENRKREKINSFVNFNWKMKIGFRFICDTKFVTQTILFTMCPIFHFPLTANVGMRMPIISKFWSPMHRSSTGWNSNTLMHCPAWNWLNLKSNFRYTSDKAIIISKNHHKNSFNKHWTLFS